ncbi:hypothetical protein ACLOJK_036341 [Asimina triloba]
MIARVATVVDDDLGVRSLESATARIGDVIGGPPILVATTCCRSGRDVANAEVGRDEMQICYRSGVLMNGRP